MVRIDAGGLPVGEVRTADQIRSEKRAARVRVRQIRVEGRRAAR